MSKYRDAKRDQHLADADGLDREQMCHANGCPNRWAVDFGDGRLCSAHSRAARHLWPQITQEQIDAETERAWQRSQRVEPVPALPMSRAEKRAALSRLAAVGAQLGRIKPRDWAYALRDREQSGERLTDLQRKAWRGVIGAHQDLDRHDGASAELVAEYIE